MKVILNKLLTLCLFIVAIGCFYLTFTMTFISSFVNFALFFVAVFFLIQACGMFDKTQGYGQYSDETDKEPEPNTEVTENEEEQPIEQNNNYNDDDYKDIEVEDDDYSDYD